MRYLLPLISHKSAAILCHGRSGKGVFKFFCRARRKSVRPAIAWRLLPAKMAESDENRNFEKTEEPKRKRRRLEIWVREKGDLTTVCISCENSNKINTESTFLKLSFDGQSETDIRKLVKQVTGIRPFLSLKTETIRCVTEKLKPLRNAIEPLKNLIAAQEKKITWDVYEDKFVPEGLCRIIFSVFIKT